MIQVKNISFAYLNYPPLFENLSFIVNDGGLLLAGGPSGCGKTTLLYCLCGIIPRNISGAFSGGVFIDGESIADISRAELPEKIAIVFQEPGNRMFLPALEDESAFTPENLCVPPEEMRRRVDEALELTGLSEKQYANPAQLSGGQLKLAALAAVLTVPPRVLLLDELTSGLDVSAVKRALDCVGLLRNRGCAVIASDHNTGLWDGLDGLRILSMGDNK